MIKLLESTDYYRYYKLINEFRKTDYSYNNFCNFINQPNINIWVIEVNNEIIGTGTLLLEQKLIHNFGIVAHIEDVVISKNYKGKKYGIKLILHLIQKSKEKSCYKIILNCNEDIKEFYKKSNFNVSGLQMSYYT